MKNRIVLITYILMMCLMLNCIDSAEPEEDFYEMRRAMVTQQIVARGVKDERVIEAMVKVPRHRFVLLASRALSYTDRPLPIGEGQTISQPYIVALMTELLDLDGDEKVLEIGTGSGYQAAVLAELAKEVYTIEILEPLAKRSERLLKEMGYENVRVRCGDGYQGWKEFAPYDAIIVTCAPPAIPEELFNQLKEGGRMVVPVGGVSQELLVIRKKNGKMETTSVLPVRFVPMIEEE